MKKYFSYNDIHNTIEEMARRIQKSPFVPDLMIAIGTGGFIPARMLKTYLNIPILTVGIAYYDLENKKMDHPVITQWLDQPEKQIKGKRILLVDEVDDTRATIGFCLSELFKDAPEEIALAVLHSKHKQKSCPMPEEVRHIFHGLDLENQWINYPWDAENIDLHKDHS